ncbi:MAG: aminodeoxychorismate/anthranilate synthase component II [Brumimicrobium sp.]
MKILIIDNYDSFTYNLFHYVDGLDVEIDVFRNDEIDIDQLSNYDKIILSPGPGLPKDSGLLYDVIKKTPIKTPILGVCLGMQAMAEIYQGKLYNMNHVKHGVAVNSNLSDNHYIFEGLPNTFQVGLYHSWAVELPLPNCWRPLLMSEDGIVMAMAHNQYDLVGVQFHPESVLTPHGRRMIQNFIAH